VTLSALLQPESLWNVIVVLLQRQPPKLSGVYPRVSDLVMLTDILFVACALIYWNGCARHFR